MAVRITTEAIEALEKLGVAEAVNELGEMLREGDALGRHGERGWEALSNEELCAKIDRHNVGLGMFYAYDDGTRRSAWACLASRALMALQRVVKKVRTEKGPQF